MILRRFSLLLGVLPLAAACGTSEPAPGPEGSYAGTNDTHRDAGRSGTHSDDSTNSGTPGSGKSSNSPPTPDAGKPTTVADSGKPATQVSTDEQTTTVETQADAGDEPLNPGLAVLVALDHLDSCQELNEALRERSRATMNAQLDALKAQVVADAGTAAWCNVYWSAPSGGGGTVGLATPGVAAGNAAAESADKSAAPTSVSETNNQVVGVDEADIVKTDGKYIYLTQGSELRVVAAWPADQTKLVSTLALGGTAKKLLLHQDRLIAFVSKPRTTTTATQWMRQTGRDCTYGYDCDFTGDGTATDLVIIDVADRAHPKALRRLSFSGSLIAARSIGGTVHAVVSIADLNVPNLTTPNVQQYCYARAGEDAGAQDRQAAALAEIEKVRAQNNKLIDAATFDFGTIATEGQQPVGATDCSDVYREMSGDGSALTTVASLNLESDSAPTLANVISRAGAVYASSTGLYISVSHQRNAMRMWYPGQDGTEASTVHQFRIGQDPTATMYLGSGLVPGRVLNQFSMDEYADHLRIATTKGHVPDPNVESTLSVLRLRGNTLDLVGQIDGIAPTEDIRSVRFDGERGYLVSFKKTDPLFVLDLATPSAPKIVGELKIPGFSTYMHQLDSNHLLALGYEADDQGSFAYFNGIQLQIFDVTNPTEPALLHKKVYGTRGSSSSALTDHLGFTFLRDRGLLTLPMTICDGGGNGRYGSLAFSGVVALNASVAGGIVELGRLEEPYPASMQSSGFSYGSACQDWWTNSSSVVLRTVVLDNFLYAISNNRVHVQDLDKLGTDVRVVEFVPADAAP